MQKQSQPQTTNNPKERDASVQIRAGRHTPGPWNIDGRTIVSGLKEEARYWEKAIADMVPDYKVPLKERQANAQLIAAAPELLEALKSLMPEIRQYRGKILMDGSSPDCQCKAYDLLNEKIEAANAAIAKAKGEEK